MFYNDGEREREVYIYLEPKCPSFLDTLSENQPYIKNPGFLL